MEDVLRVYHAEPREMLMEHWMGASSAAIAGIPSAHNQRVIPLLLGGGFTITESPPGVFTIGLGGPGGPYVLKAGDTMTGSLVFKSNPGGTGIQWEDEAGTPKYALAMHGAPSNDSLIFFNLLSSTTLMQFEPPGGAAGLVHVPVSLQAGTHSSVAHALLGYKNSLTEWPLLLRQDNAASILTQQQLGGNPVFTRYADGRTVWGNFTPAPSAVASNGYTTHEYGASGGFAIVATPNLSQCNLTTNAYAGGSPFAWRYTTGSGGGASLYQANASRHIWYSAAAGSTGAAITWAVPLDYGKDVAVALQAAGAAQAGTGIAFPAAQFASAGANVLDDYEEGTWAPYDATSGGALPGRYGATYVKIGRMVMLTLGYYAGSTSSSGDQFVIAGAPFVAYNNVGWEASAQYGFTSITINPSHMTQNGYVGLYGYNGSAGALTRAQISGQNMYALSCAYETYT